jgi:hypothetical protein
VYRRARAKTLLVRSSGLRNKKRRKGKREKKKERPPNPRSKEGATDKDSLYHRRTNPKMWRVQEQTKERGREERKRKAAKERNKKEKKGKGKHTASEAN